MSILIFIIILLVLVLAHEFGHFFTAKKFGIRVDEFGFGFPPRLFGFKKGDTEYTFNLLPIGGFVKIFGENPNDENNTDGSDKQRNFMHKPKYQQALVLVAGVLANFLLAWLLFSFGFISGLPTSVDSRYESGELIDVHLAVISVMPDSPAEKVGLKPGDRITSIKLGNDYTEYVNPETVKSFVAQGEELEIGYRRKQNNTDNFLKITPVLNPEGIPMIGIAMDQVGIARLSFFRAFGAGLMLTVKAVLGTAQGLFNLILDGLRGKGNLASVTGPVGLVGVVGDAYDFGFVYLLSFAALISANLSIINLLPFPALDGGRLFFLLIEKIKGSPINPKIANVANLTGFVLLLLFMLLITYHDIVKLI